MKVLTLGPVQVPVPGGGSVVTPLSYIARISPRFLHREGCTKIFDDLLCPMYSDLSLCLLI